MGTSAITISALTATPSIQGNKLSATLVLTGPDTNIPNLQPDSVEFHRSTTNDRTTASLAATARAIISGTAEVSDDGLLEETAYYYWAKVKNKLGNYGAWFPSGSTSGTTATAKGISGVAFGLANGKIIVTENSPSSNKMTIEVKTRTGADPSSSDPVYCAFRDASTGGAYVVRAITAALSLVISNGSTLATSNSRACRIWLSLHDDAGTVRLGAANLAVSAALGGIDEGALWSTTAEGGAGAADSGGVFYTGTAVTSKPIRLIGYATWNSGLATAGNWASAPSVVQLVGIGTKKPGDVIRKTINGTGSYQASLTGSIPNDNTIPQNSEGEMWNSLTVTPSSPANVYEVTSILSASRATAGPIIHTICRSDVSSCLTSGEMSLNADEVGTHTMWAGGDVFNATSFDFQQRFGAGGTAMALGGIAAGQRLGGSLANYVLCTEIMG